MKIQIVSKYLSLSEEGLVPRIECPMDQGLLMSNLDDEDNIILYCLSCSYKKIIGISLYNEMQELINNAVKK